MFAQNIHLALRQLSQRFGSNINDAYRSDPAKNEKKRELEREDSKVTNQTMKEIVENNRAIDVDMQILHEAKVKGEDTPVDKFQAFDRLGQDTYLLNMIDDLSDSDDDYDDDETDDDDDDDEEEEEDQEVEIIGGPSAVADQEPEKAEEGAEQAAANTIDAQKLALQAATKRAAAAFEQFQSAIPMQPEAPAPRQVLVQDSDEEDDSDDDDDDSDDDDDYSYDSEYDSDWDSDDDSFGNYDDLMRDMNNQGLLSASIARMVSDNEDNVEADYAMEEAQWR